MRNLLIAILLAGCGAPLLRNAPRPDPAYVAAGAAAVAGTLTALDPDGQARNVEEASAAGRVDDQVGSEVVPADVFDRLH
jgi:hypothetical protein